MSKPDLKHTNLEPEVPTSCLIYVMSLYEKRLHLCMSTGAVPRPIMVRRKGQGQGTNIKMIISIPGWGVALLPVPSPQASPPTVHSHAE